MKLNTIQKEGKLNEVYTFGTEGPGGAYHCYVVTSVEELPWAVSIVFQTGPRNTANSTPGVLDSDLLEIVRDRLTAFQRGDYACEENEEALSHIEKALEWMNMRVKNRISRGVLGTNKK